jgi:NAD(P)-dependent dehydrogenase (short-subunit alcohol dehydrogenase family)
MISAIVPIRRPAECEEVSDTIAFLCSLAASYINGTSVIIDAGVTTTVRMF